MLAAEVALTETQPLWGGQQRPGGVTLGEGRGEAPQGAAEKEGDIWHFFPSFKPDPGRAWEGGLPCPGLEGQSSQKSSLAEAEVGFQALGFHREAKRDRAVPPMPYLPTSNPVYLQCPPLHSPWQPSSGQDPRAAAPLAVGEVFWLQHEAAHVAGGQAAGLGTGRRLVHGLVLAQRLARSLSLQDAGLCRALRR